MNPSLAMVEQLITIFVTFLVVVDPVGVSPMFAALTRGGNARYRRRMALKGTFIATLITLFFVFTGDAVLRFLGISLAAFRVSGGLLLLLLGAGGFILLQKRRTLHKAMAAQKAQNEAAAAAPAAQAPKLDLNLPEQ